MSEWPADLGQHSGHWVVQKARGLGPATQGPGPGAQGPGLGAHGQEVSLNFVTSLGPLVFTHKFMNSNVSLSYE